MWRHRDTDVRDIEEQEEFLAHANIEVLRDLFLRQRTTVHRRQANSSHERIVTADFTTDHDGKGVLPVDERAARNRVSSGPQFAVHINATTVNRVVGRDNVLQSCLQYFVSIRCRQCRVTVQVSERIALASLRSCATGSHSYTESVATRSCGWSIRRVADDARHFLRNVCRYNPGFDRKLTGFLQYVIQLSTGRRRSLRPAAVGRNTPAAKPGHFG